MVRFAVRIFLLCFIVLLALLGARHRADLWAIALVPIAAYLLAAAPGVGAGDRPVPPLGPEARRRLVKAFLVWAIVLVALPAVALIPLYYALKSPGSAELQAFATGFANVAVEISWAARVGYGSFNHTGELGPGGPTAYATVMGLAGISAALFQAVAWTYMASVSTLRELAVDLVNRSPGEHAKLVLVALSFLTLLYLVGRGTTPAADVTFSYDCRGCVFWQIPPLAIPFEVLVRTAFWLVVQGAVALPCAAAYRAFHGPILPRPGD